MATSASSHGTVHPARALQRVGSALPARTSGRVLALRIAQQAVPVVARSVAAGMAVLAVEQAVRRFVDGASERALPARRAEASPSAYVATTISVTETIVIERVRRRR